MPCPCITLLSPARAGIPKGVINVVPCSRANAPKVGTELATNVDVRKLSFTGSTAVGKLLMQQCASTVKRVSLELGGNGPFIVFAMMGCLGPLPSLFVRGTT